MAACNTNVYTPLAYRNPSVYVNAIKSLKPGQWLSMQSYVFVDGYRHKHWDCRSSDPKLHWTADVERYCWKDYLKILDALTSRPDIVVTDPQSVAQSWYPEMQKPATADETTTNDASIGALPPDQSGEEHALCTS